MPKLDLTQEERTDATKNLNFWKIAIHLWEHGTTPTQTLKELFKDPREFETEMQRMREHKHIIEFEDKRKPCVRLKGKVWVVKY